MAIKHFEEYFKVIEEQYLEMKNDLEQLEQVCLKKAVDPDMIDNYKKTLAPIKELYNTLAHVQYLLHLPNRKEKTKKFRKDKYEQISKAREKHCKDINMKLKEDLRNA